MLSMITWKLSTAGVTEQWGRPPAPVQASVTEELGLGVRFLLHHGVLQSQVPVPLQHLQTSAASLSLWPGAPSRWGCF